VIHYIKTIAEFNSSEVQTRKQDGKTDSEGKKFLPDVVAVSHNSNEKRIFEVEKTVNNNTVYKSLMSLLTALMEKDCQYAYLVVPDNKIEFAEGCLKNLVRIIRRFSKISKGAHPKIKISIVGFSCISEDFKKIETYQKQGRIGRPPKCRYMLKY
jgi:hypothetical protein